MLRAVTQAPAPTGGPTSRPWTSSGGARDMDAEPRSAKGRRTRARLLEAGKTIFERDGFLQARISDIAAEANVSHGSFYHYFDSKEALFREIAEEVEVRLVSMDDLPTDDKRAANPIERI